MNTYKRMIPVAIMLLLFIFNCSAWPQDQAKNKFLVLTLDNKIIGPIITDYISSGIDKAKQENYQGVMIIMDTPGGLLESTRTIVKKIMNSNAPVINPAFAIRD